MKVQKKTPPATNRGLTEALVLVGDSALLDVTKPVRQPRRMEDTKAIALSYLKLTRQQMEAARRNRVVFIELGQQYGLTNVEIGSALGMTEANVRSLVKRGDSE